MADLILDAELDISTSQFRYVVSAQNNTVLVRAPFKAMFALRRDLVRLINLDLSPFSFSKLSSLLPLTLKWKWGPLRLTLMRSSCWTPSARMLLYFLSPPKKSLQSFHV